MAFGCRGIISKTPEGCLDDPRYQWVPFTICTAEQSGWARRVSFPLLDILQDLDEVFQAKNIARIWSVIGGVLTPGALVCRVSKVDHPDVNFGEPSGRAAMCSLSSLLRMRAPRSSFQQLLPVVDDEERAGVEAV